MAKDQVSSGKALEAKIENRAAERHDKKAIAKSRPTKECGRTPDVPSLIQTSKTLLRTKQYQEVYALLKQIDIKQQDLGLDELDFRADFYQKMSKHDEAMQDTLYMVERWNQSPKAYRRHAKSFLCKNDEVSAQGVYCQAMIECPSEGNYQYRAMKREAQKLLRRLRTIRKKDPLELPSELVAMVFDMLSFETKCRCLGVSRHWHMMLTSDAGLWRRLRLWRSEAKIEQSTLQKYLQYSGGNVKELTMDLEKMGQNDIWLVQQCPNLEILDVGAWLDCRGDHIYPSVRDMFISSQHLHRVIIHDKIRMELQDIRVLLDKCSQLEELRLSGLWKDDYYCDMAKAYLDQSKGPTAPSLKYLTFTLTRRSTGNAFNLDYLVDSAPALEELRIRATLADDSWHDEWETPIKVAFAKFPNLRTLALRAVTLTPFCLPSQLKELEMVGNDLLNRRVAHVIDHNEDASEMFMEQHQGLPNLQALTLKGDEGARRMIPLAARLLDQGSSDRVTKLKKFDIAHMLEEHNTKQLFTHGRLEELQIFGVGGTTDYARCIDDTFLTKLSELRHANLNIKLKKDDVLGFIANAPHLRTISIDGDLGGDVHYPAFIRRVRDDCGVDMHVRTKAYKGTVWHVADEEEDLERLAQPI